ncbi:type II toxin-antitoxin system VapC family toxin [Nguyenibacter sp. L1]|uniref:type II toxin-antitoxin system VapC family toxin n=1 Tax=Nguyenibacter sp. L1 TaxID=3049350 RepID=UPI002B4A7FBB|nr:type II toxin-antitoxin system VapC family toxin [Nguyenibacter sp. L1]WRH87783.1 type II toxin-antitoxin system VapC family toxin [Nguyenibacter sp. L1]
MYFDSQALTALLSDEALARKLAPAIQADWKRMTSPLAVVETVLALGKPDEPGKTHAETQDAIASFLDAHDIELRDMPPVSKLVPLAGEAAGNMAAPDVMHCLNAACAAYYEMEMFRIDDALAALPGLPGLQSRDTTGDVDSEV